MELSDGACKCHLPRACPPTALSIELRPTDRSGARLAVGARMPLASPADRSSGEVARSGRTRPPGGGGRLVANRRERGPGRKRGVRDALEAVRGRVLAFAAMAGGPGVSRRRFLRGVIASGAGAWWGAQAVGGARARAAATPRPVGVAVVGLGNLSLNEILPALTKTTQCRLAALVKIG